MQICLIFAWGFSKGSNDELSFVSLEPVARQLHVNLAKVIVYNCCPAVPSHGGISRRGRYTRMCHCTLFMCLRSCSQGIGGMF